MFIAQFGCRERKELSKDINMKELKVRGKLGFLIFLSFEPKINPFAETFKLN